MTTEIEPSLGELFRRSRGAAVEHHGRTVHPIFEREFEEETSVTVRLESLRARPEGICLKIANGSFIINEQKLTEAVLWTDTAPPEVAIVCRPKGKALLKIWNTWKDEHGVQHAWIGNSGMLVEHSGERVCLRCSDGIGGVDFDDLTVWLTFRTA